MIAVPGVGAGPVLVGFASSTAGAVLDAAARAASMLTRDVVLLHVSRDASLSVGDGAAVAELAAQHLRGLLGTGTDVSVRATNGPAADALVRASHGACLLVLGSDRDAGLAEVVHHDVITTVATRAACPVLVAHTRSDAPGPDPVVTVEAGDPGDTGDGSSVAAAIAGALGQPLRVLPHLEGRGSAQALVDASTTSSVVVLTRGTDGGHVRHLSDAGRLVLRDAHCPVLVVDPPSSAITDLPAEEPR